MLSIAIIILLMSLIIRVILTFLLNLPLVMVLQLFTILIVHVMINSCKSTKAINSFQFVAIPSPRDVFARYGERLSDKGVYSCGVEGGSPQMVSSSSVIEQMISAQNLLEADMAAQQTK